MPILLCSPNIVLSLLLGEALCRELGHKVVHNEMLTPDVEFLWNNLKGDVPCCIVIFSQFNTWEALTICPQWTGLFPDTPIIWCDIEGLDDETRDQLRKVAWLDVCSTEIKNPFTSLVDGVRRLIG